MEKVITYYYDDIICEKFYRLNNKIHWEYKSFYITGEPEIIASYDKGKLDGLFIKLYKNGLIEEKILYVDGRKEGECVNFYDNGVPKEKIHYVNNKIKSIILYHPDGTINKP